VERKLNQFCYHISNVWISSSISLFFLALLEIEDDEVLFAMGQEIGNLV